MKNICQYQAEKKDYLFDLPNMKEEDLINTIINIRALDIYGEIIQVDH